MYTLKIKITKEILEKTKKCSNDDLTTNCAIAYAVRDIFPNAITFNFELAPYGTLRPEIHLPMQASMFIAAFDNSTAEQRINMPEIEFDIMLSDEVINRINIDEIKPLLVNHPTLTLINA